MFDLDDLVLAVVEASEGRVEGRTRLVKLAYFVAELMDLGVGFEPHLYGPYSSGVTATAEGQVNRGLLGEEMETFQSFGFPGHDYDRRRYTYTLTDRGREALELRRGWDPEGFEKAEKIVRRLNATDADYRVLSYAAKLWLILQQVGGKVTYADARREAKELGWHMTKDQIDQAVDLLQQIGLVRKGS
jgi:uncharacterized protein YwgA